MYVVNSNSQNIMDAKSRIRKYIKSMKITVQAFEASIGMSNGYMSHTKSPTAGVLSEIARVYPNLNMEWVITGEGFMCKNENSLYSGTSSNVTGDIGSNSVIAVGNVSNVGNTRNYKIPKKGFLKIIHSDGSEEDIAGDAGLMEALNECKMLRLENDYLKGIVKDKDRMINLLEKSLEKK